MGEAARTSGEAVGEPTRADEIRKEIEQTREELGETVEALAAKTDVKAQAKAKVEDTKDRAQAKADEAKARAQAKVDEATARAQSTVEEARQRALAKVEAVRRRTGASPDGSATTPTYAAPGADASGRPYGVPAGSQQLRGAVASPATYVVIGALAGLLLGVVLARR
jgi:regulator of protease activity HflC (stomatin/prohibitin superfamily)